MRVRTKLFFTLSAVVLLLLSGTIGPLHRTISDSLERMTTANFAGTRQSLHSLQNEQISRMRQAGSMLMDIPELRALIAEENFEISQENRDSLIERLDSLADVVNVGFVCVLDARGTLIAQNSHSPWRALNELHDYISQSAQAKPLIMRLYASANQKKHADQGEYGLWSYQGKLYQVVGLPLIFSAGQDQTSRSDGALVMATPVSDDLATNLGATHDCQISFLAGPSIAASSLAPNRRRELLAAYHNANWPLSAPFDVNWDGQAFRSFLEPLVDQSSNTTVGAMLIQSSLTDGQAAESKMIHTLFAIMSIGLVAAGVLSFVVSGAISRPVQRLLKGVHRVAAGDLDSSIPIQSKDELGQLAAAFNDMVFQLRTRRELQRLVEESQAASKAKSQFLANMSHEIRTPLHGVMGMANLLLQTKLDDSQRRYANLVKTSSEVLATLINDILDFSKIEAGKMELEAVDFDLVAVVKDAVELLSQKAAAKKVELICQISPQVPAWVSGDSNRLRQILMNLIGNAIKFTETGKITVELKPQDDALIYFAVHDTGIGIPQDRVDRLFKSFSQVDASTTRRYGGTGLGLAISKQLVELMGGNIGVQSTPGEGSTFWFTAKFQPATNPMPQSSIDSTDDRLVAAKPYRILVAEDNEVNQIVANEVLTQAGYQCDVVADGSSAVDAVINGKYDLILMDCQMPKMDGFAATGAIRKHEQASGAGRIPIIALTANASGADRDRCLGAGMDAYSGKPFQPRELLQTIASFLSGEKTPTPESSPGSKTLLDFQKLLETCSGNAGLAQTILTKFQQQSSDALSQIETFMKAQDAAGVARIAHALKGSAGTVAAEPLRAIAAKLEELGRAKTLQSADTYLTELRNAVTECSDFINQTRAQATNNHANSDRR